MSTGFLCQAQALQAASPLLSRSLARRAFPASRAALNVTETPPFLRATPATASSHRRHSSHSKAGVWAQPPAATVNHTAHARATSRPETHRFGSVRSTTKPADGANVTYSICLLLLCLWDPDARPRVARLHSLSQHEHAEKNSERTSSSNSCT